MHTTHVFSMKTSPEDSSSNASTGGALGSNEFVVGATSSLRGVGRVLELRGRLPRLWFVPNGNESKEGRVGKSGKFGKFGKSGKRATSGSVSDIDTEASRGLDDEGDSLTTTPSFLRLMLT